MNLRPATIRDDAFCFALNEATMREYVEPVYGWDADIQRTYHARWFEPDRLSIIEDDDGREVGVLDVRDEGDHLYLCRIEIMPDDQGRGLGTAVVTALLGRGRMVRLDVFPDNLRARRFYERLGFAVDRHHGREGRLSMYHSGPWNPAGIGEVAAIFSEMQTPWWIAGGHAIDLAVGRVVRDHEDIDVLVLRRDQGWVRHLLADWQCWVADPPGTLRLWAQQETLEIGIHDIWCRPQEGDPWRMQIMLDESAGDDWVSRRSARVRRPISSLGLMSAEGVPYLAPEVQLFYKAKDPRPRDEIDFAATLPVLAIEQREWLSTSIGRCYDEGHPWRAQLQV